MYPSNPRSRDSCHQSRQLGQDCRPGHCQRAVRAFSQANEAQFHVSMSRARFAMHVFTDSKVALRDAVTRPSKRLSSWEIADATENHRVSKAELNRQQHWLLCSPGNFSQIGWERHPLCAVGAELGAFARRFRKFIIVPPFKALFAE